MSDSLPRSPPRPPHVLFSSTATPPPALYTLSLHDALPISAPLALLVDQEGSGPGLILPVQRQDEARPADRKSTRLNSSHRTISYAVFCLKKKKNTISSPTHTPTPPRRLCLAPAPTPRLLSR